MSHYSYTSIDVGFDLRLHPEIEIEIPADATSVGCETASGEQVTISGGRAAIAAALREHGYRVQEG
jgi:hypothetical protein